MLRVATAAACLLAAIAAGCGSVDGSPGSDPPATLTTTDADHASPLLSFEKAGYSVSVMWLLEKEPERVPATKRYGVFRRSSTPQEADVTRRVTEHFACSMVAENDESDAGKPIPDLTRILLSKIGPSDYDLVAQPTTLEGVSVGLFPDGSGSCGASPPEGFTLSAEIGDDRTAIVYGLVPDGVLGVDLIVGGEKNPARLGENGYALVIPEAVGKTVERMRLHRTDGSVTEIPSP